MYTVRNLRANLKQALDAAEAGKTVVIHRGKDLFTLSLAGATEAPKGVCTHGPGPRCINCP